MKEDQENLSQDRKIDKLQFQMEGLKSNFDEFKNVQKESNSSIKEINNRLETMQKGLVGREEFREHQAFVGTLATQKDLDKALEEINALKDVNKWLARLVIGSVITAAIAALIITR